MLVLVMGFLLLRLFVSLGNALSRPYLRRATQLADPPLLSVLVPARNEAHNLPRLLTQLEGLSYPRLEILLLDDQSEDETPVLLAAQAARDTRFGWLRGAAVPPGWLGKNWACHQLGLAARGEYLLFVDADIAAIDPALPARAIGELRRLGLSLLSIFPDQQMEGWGEKIVVPLMHYVLLSLLPLWWIYRLPQTAFAAANGQFMLFDGTAYRQHHWHARVRHIIVEDIAIMRAVKQAGLRGMAYLADGAISCRMYRSYREGLHGFGKNILAGFGGRIFALLIYLFCIYFAWVPLAGQLDKITLLLSCGMILAINLLNSYSARQALWRNLLLHPVQISSLALVGLLSIYKNLSGHNAWKGRNIRLPRPSSSWRSFIRSDW